MKKSNNFICKIEGKFDQDLAQEAFQWIEDVVGESVQPAPETGEKVQEALSDGVFLCKYGITFYTSTDAMLVGWLT